VIGIGVSDSQALRISENVGIDGFDSVEVLVPRIAVPLIADGLVPSGVDKTPPLVSV